MSVMLSLCLAWSSATPAAKLHKCVDPGGTASYQSLPCPAGQRSEWVRELPPDAAAPAAPRPEAAGSPRPPRKTVRPRARPTPAPASESPCKKARRSAKATRDRLWNRLTFKQRSELDAEVARACKR